MKAYFSLKRQQFVLPFWQGVTAVLYTLWRRLWSKSEAQITLSLQIPLSWIWLSLYNVPFLACSWNCTVKRLFLYKGYDLATIVKRKINITRIPNHIHDSDKLAAEPERLRHRRQTGSGTWAVTSSKADWQRKCYLNLDITAQMHGSVIRLFHKLKLKWFIWRFWSNGLLFLINIFLVCFNAGSTSHQGLLRLTYSSI